VPPELSKTEAVIPLRVALALRSSQDDVRVKARRITVRIVFSVVSCFVVFVLGVGVSTAQETDVIEVGKREFQRSCATCHGVDATGNGPAAAALLVKPADLTQLAKRHGGVFLFWQRPGAHSFSGALLAVDSGKIT
jgi:Cytochrome c